jgi:chromosome partitioning protein
MDMRCSAYPFTDAGKRMIAEREALAATTQRKHEAETIAVCNQKGGVGKTTTCANLGVGLAMQGKRVLLVDADPQGDLTASLGWPNADELDGTLASLMGSAVRDEPVDIGSVMLRHAEGVDLIPANIELSGMETSLVNAMSREFVLKNVLAEAKSRYDYIIIDCMPSLGMITINALAAADKVLIPVQAQYLPAKGMTQLIKTVTQVRKQINPALGYSGVLLTLVDGRTALARKTSEAIRRNYGGIIRVFASEIPIAVKAAETGAAGKSIFAYDRNSPAAKAYAGLAKEVMRGGARNKPAASLCR